MPHDPIELARIQRWLQAVIMHPDGVAAGADSQAARSEIDLPPDAVERLVERSRALTGLERLRVYGHAYYARLLECLRDEFPATAHAVGRETFDGFAFAYLQAYPSTSYTLAKLGGNFPRYLRETRPPRDPGDPAGGPGNADRAGGGCPDWADFLIDLATFERTCAEVFDGPGPEGREPLPADVLARVPPDRFADVRLTPSPCLRLLELRFPVHEYATAVRQASQPEVPEPRPTWLAVSRREFVVRRRSVSQPQFELLTALIAGRTLGEAIERAAGLAGADRLSEEGDRPPPSGGHSRVKPQDPGASPPFRTAADIDAFAADLRRWFAEWTAAGWFERIDVPGLA